jgi:HEAT repeat protein
MARKQDVDGLIRALGYEDLVRDRDDQVIDLGVDVRCGAADALAGIEGRAALHGLLRALDDPEDAVRIAAVRGLCRQSDPLAAEQLTWVITNWTEPQHARARHEVLDALVSLNDPMAPRRVIAGLMTRTAELDADADREVVQRLVQAGGHNTLEGTVDELVTRLSDGPPAGGRARQMLVWLAPDSVEPLIRALDDDARRREAIFALGAIHDSRAVERLGAILLGDDAAPIRTAAAWALGEIKDPSAVETLLVATGDAEYQVRSEAGQSFDKLGNAAIAVAMSALILPALENGAGDPKDAIEVGESEGAPGLEDAPTAVHEVRAPPAPAPAAPPTGRPATQAGPMLRRLLGWRANS